MADVDAAIAARDAAVAARAAELSGWSEAVTVRDAMLGERDAALLAAGARIDELDRVGAHLSRLVVQRERELDGLREQIDEVCAQARGYATRVRMQALRQAAAMTAPDRNGNCNGSRSVPANGAIAASEPEDGATADHEAAAETAAEAPESTFGVRPAAPPDLFEGIVQLEIGPLSDFSQLVGFEDAAGAIGAASEISVTRFSQGRASLDVRLSEPVDLLRELEQRSPFEFKLRSMRDGRLILDLDDEAEAV
ncbi:MAG: hypothetical protein ACR2OC_07000 [Solirubrobacterales bacterium]